MTFNPYVSGGELKRVNVYLGSGYLFAADIDTSGAKTSGWKNLGSLQDVTLSTSSDRTTIFDGSGAVATTLIDAIRDHNVNASATLMNINAQNLSYFLLGPGPQEHTQTANTAKVELHTVSAGEWIQLGTSTGDQKGAREITAVANIVTGADGTGTTVAASNYKVYPSDGMVYIKPSATINDSKKVTVTYSVPAKTFEYASTPASPVDVRVALKYKESSGTGIGYDVEIPDARLVGEGDISLLSRDTNLTIPLSITINSPSTGEDKVTFIRQVAS